MISTPFVELLNQDGEANPFVGVQVRRQTGKEKLCPQTGPRVTMATQMALKMVC